MMNAAFGEMETERIPRSLLLERSQPDVSAKSAAPARKPAGKTKDSLANWGDCLPLNLDELTRRCMGRTDFAERLLQSFEKRFPDELQEIVNSLELEDSTRLARLVHQLRGTTANICAPALTQILQQIEELIESRRVTEIPRWIDLADRQFQRFTEYRRSIGSVAQT
jgi:HPt (histidine-containing phosphotransfer) domain-containing protein